MCRTPAGSPGSTVTANRVFRVLAGGSLRCALCAASTAPVRASATSQESAVTRGTRGAPARGRTWTPGRFSSNGCGPTARGPPGGLGSARPGAATAAGMRASSPVAHSTPVETATREESPRIMRST
ncbi:hypothetical protein GCM10010384_45000 [Streptomyces djakartensis]|uniref:Secreted protein n=1 Tax=Streptomyces djakartensis TaxID=68193 RepID=A0ABQ3A5H8_9ACTN|nr:hypothetical protein GCM10010384_45000 [Streptomyces djakartensis]